MPLLLIAGAVVVLLVIFFTGGEPEQLPDPDPDNGAQVEDWPEFDGTVFFNQEELALENTPLVAKGMVHLPLLELAAVLDVAVTVDDDSNVIFVGETGEVDQGDEEDAALKIYRGNTEITPSNIIRSENDFFVNVRELAPMLGVYNYENMFANALYLMDQQPVARDGEYAAVLKRDARGWAPQLQLTIVGGSVVAVEYSERDEQGKNKFDDAGYLENWGNAVEADPLELIAAFKSQFLEGQSLDMDLVSGATGSQLRFMELASLLVGKAKADALDFVYADGHYVVVGAPGQQGWMPVIEMTVQNGRITAFRYDDRDEEGNSKRANNQYIQNWRNAYPEVDPLAIIAQREEDILVSQDPNTIDAMTGATAWGVNIKKLTTGALDHAVRAEVGMVQQDTIYVFVGETSDRGDRPQLLIAMAGEEMALVDFSDYRNGIAKKFDQPYLSNWQNQYPDVDPLAVLAEMESTFQETGDPEALDEISGATGWRNSFQQLAQRALEFIGSQ